MTKEEFQRWRDFALRLARHGWPEATDARKEKIADQVEGFIDQYEPYMAEVGGWDGCDGKHYICDDIDEWFGSNCHQHQDPMRTTRFEDQISACVRAGLDVACYPSAGVIGFTVGTLRRMYDGNVPGWVREFFKPPLPSTAADTEGVWL